MADYFYAQMTIGGPVPRELIPQLVEKVEAEGLLTGQVESRRRDLQFYLEDGLLVFEDSDARYGSFEELEGFLQAHNIEFDRWSDSRYEFNPELVTFRRETGLQSSITEKERASVLYASDVEDLLELDDMAKVKEKIRELVGPEVPALQRISPDELAPARHEEV